ncbi:hypothetical protein RMSM_00659 [Rhodopirellula maiorica SM1]|uniref:Uncharacterized protein n=1 Tax=Rhodopirellula maiorica SM1 TaxID=1265738 RepID=M5S8B6_9BACT|nr:hypothetical protein RMSM_00659 [Rhodopirellula maiorica SM1]
MKRCTTFRTKSISPSPSTFSIRRCLSHLRVVSHEFVKQLSLFRKFNRSDPIWIVQYIEQ